MKKKIILIHGNGGGTVDELWFPWLRHELARLPVGVVARNFPDSDLARKKYWLPFLHDELDADEETIIVGHSSGGLAAMRYAEAYPIHGSILIGVNHTHLDNEMERASGYYDTPWAWDRIRANQQWIVQFASPEDPLIPIEEARYVHEQLATEYYELVERGHFMEDTFPELIDVLQRKILS